MKKQILSEEFRRMQKLAGIINESADPKGQDIALNFSNTAPNTSPGAKAGKIPNNEAVEDISQEIQDLIDKNGKVQATPADAIEGNKFVLLFSQSAADHIKERHLDGAKPGSLFKNGVNLRDVAKKILNMTPNEEKDGRVKWLGVNGGDVGEMGVAKASPEEVAKMKDYTMPDGGKEQVKIAPGKRKPTSEVSLVTFDLGTLSNGKTLLSVATMFPGGMTVDGTQIPMGRGEFASKGLYFVVDPSSTLLKEMNEGLQYFHNGSDMNQIINYDDSDITDDLESFGQGSMDGQDFKPGETYNIGGKEYKVEPQGDEFKLVLIESIDNIEKLVNEALAKFRKK